MRVLSLAVLVFFTYISILFADELSEGLALQKLLHCEDLCRSLYRQSLCTTQLQCGSCRHSYLARDGLCLKITDDVPGDEAQIDSARAYAVEQQERQDEQDNGNAPSYYSYRVHHVPAIPSGHNKFSVLRALGLSRNGFLDPAHLAKQLSTNQGPHNSMLFDKMEPIRGELDYAEVNKPSESRVPGLEDRDSFEEPIYEDTGINWNIRGGEMGDGQLLEQHEQPKYTSDKEEEDDLKEEESEEENSQELDDEADNSPQMKKNKDEEDLEIAPHAPAALTQDDTGKHSLHAVNTMADVYFLAVVTGCSIAGVVGLIVAGVCWYRLQKNVKAASDVDYPAYGVTGPTKERLSSPSDRKLAQSAQMYHYQHQKQQMIAMEKAQGDLNKDGSDVDSEEENEEGDYTVFECPGLAPTGEMEVKNPLFSEDTPVTPAGETQHHK